MTLRRELSQSLGLIRGIKNIVEFSSKGKLFTLFDFWKLNRSKGITTREYFEFELEKQGPEFRNTFLGINEQRYYLDYLNPKKYYILARNKYITHKILENTGVNKSELYCYYHPEGSVLRSDEIANNLQSVIKILREKNVAKCVVKTTESSSGMNVLVIHHITYTSNDCILHLFDGSEIKLSDFLKSTPLVFEELIEQTKQLAALNETSVNTIRFMTTLFPDGEAKIIATFIKIGRSGKCVDNAGDGGNVDACIDIETGKIIYPIQFDGWRKIKDITHHPDSGNLIDGVVIDNWESIKRQVKDYQRSFPFIKAAGWDIAITEDGPIVIEVNDMWDRTGQYFIRKGWRNEIRECYLAWKETGAMYPFVRANNRLSNKKLERIVNYE
jgi:hypothetical protein